ncbi:MAG: ROK family protein [Actinobacteria bacterium]|nr:ROK family protein [Actinomycetota bacterium]
MKGALVDLDDGSLVGDRIRFETPNPSTPEAMTAVFTKILDEIDHEGPVGVGFPAVVVHGVVWTANNIDDSWIGVDGRALFGEASGREIRMINDADAAALCEARYGVARDVEGVVLVVTFGTGIGSGMLVDGVLVPNTQLGDLELDGHIPAESHFSGAVKDEEDLSWEEWGERADRFLRHLMVLFSPSLIIVGGGMGKRWDKWSHLIDGSVPTVAAQWGNKAGIVGAATLVG